jgi:hypothetical protein
MDPLASSAVESSALVELGGTVLVGFAIAAVAIAVGIALSVLWDCRRVLHPPAARARRVAR